MKMKSHLYTAYLVIAAKEKEFFRCQKLLTEQIANNLMRINRYFVFFSEIRIYIKIFILQRLVDPCQHNRQETRTRQAWAWGPFATRSFQSRSNRENFRECHRVCSRAPEFSVVYFRWRKAQLDSGISLSDTGPLQPYPLCPNCTLPWWPLVPYCPAKALLYYAQNTWDH